MVEEVTNLHRSAESPKKRRIKVDVSEINAVQGRLTELEELWSGLQHIRWDREGLVRLAEAAAEIVALPLMKKLPSINIAADTLSMRLAALVEVGDRPAAEMLAEIHTRVRILKWKVLALKGELTEDDKLAEHDEDRDFGTTRSSARPLVYLFDRDAQQRAQMALQISQNGYEVSDFEQLDNLGQAFKQQKPAAIVADAFFEEAGLDGLEAISNLAAEAGKRIPVVFIAALGDYESRRRAWGAGGDAYLMKPVNVPALIGKLDELTLSSEIEPYRVLIVDDDMMVSHFNSQILQQAGMLTHIVHKAPEVIKGLMEFKPDLILLDLYLDDCNGFDIAELIRQEEAFVNVPIFFLSGEKSRDIHLQALAVGADDFLVKPVDKDWLVSVVRSRIRRGRAMGARLTYMGRRDAMTGLYNRSYFIRRLERLIIDPPQGKLGVLYVMLDRYGDLRGELGAKQLERMIADLARLVVHSVTNEDLVARVADNSFMVLSQRKHWEHFINLAELLHKRVGEYRLSDKERTSSLSCTVGVGLCKKEESSMIIAEMEETVADAARAGGDRVQVAPSLAAIAELQDEHKNNLAQLVENAQAGRVHLAYQPIVSAHGDGVERYEVLFRIANELGEELPVAKLLSAAQNAGMMRKIDMGVLRQAMASGKKRFDRGHMATLFVKISIDSLDPEHLIKLVSHDLTVRGLPGEILVFMLPTAGVQKRWTKVGPLVDQLHDLGCHVALEYFGENRDDMLLIDRIRVDYVKFHPKLVMDLNARNNTKHLEAMQNLVRELRERNVSALMGYVEDANTMTLAWQLGVELIQGNFVQPAGGDMTFDFMDHL